MKVIFWVRSLLLYKSSFPYYYTGLLPLKTPQVNGRRSNSLDVRMAFLICSQNASLVYSDLWLITSRSKASASVSSLMTDYKMTVRVRIITTADIWKLNPATARRFARSRKKKDGIDIPETNEDDESLLKFDCVKSSPIEVQHIIKWATQIFKKPP